MCWALADFHKHKQGGGHSNVQMYPDAFSNS